jgi:hypothetical protein
MSGRNGAGSAPRATPALNGFCGPLEFQLTNAHCSAQADVASFFVHPEAHTRVRAAVHDEFPQASRRQGRARELVALLAIIRHAIDEPLKRGRGVLFADGGAA